MHKRRRMEKLRALRENYTNELKKLTFEDVKPKTVKTTKPSKKTEEE